MNLVSDALRNRFLSVVGIALAMTALAAVFVLKWPDSYTSNVEVMLAPTVGNALAPDSLQVGNQVNVAMQTEAGLIGSPAVAELMSDDVGNVVEPDDPGVSATVLANTQIISISYAADTIEDAMTFADAYARALLESRRERSESTVNIQLEDLREQEAAALKGLKKASADAVGDKSPEASGMVELYTSRLAAIQEKVGALEATPTSPGTITSPASRPTSSDGVPAPLLILAGLVAGLLLGVAYAILRERGDDRIRAALKGTVDDHPVIGVVPSSMAGATETDAYRTVRTMLLAAAKPPSSVLISAIDGSQTLDAQHVALNTASALAASGYKICLVDASLADGPIAVLPGISGGGLSSALVSGLVTKETIREGADFDILAGGDTSDATRERFGSAHMRTVLTELSRTYDYVLVVSPDLSTPEASEVALAADGVVAVAAERRTTHEAIRRVTGRTEQLGIHFFGIVAVTGVGGIRRRRTAATVSESAAKTSATATQSGSKSAAFPAQGISV